MDQQEIDYYWNALSKDGEEGPCGWLKDKYGISWQVKSVPLTEVLPDPDKEEVNRVVNSFLQMKKYDIATLENAFAG